MHHDEADHGTTENGTTENGTTDHGTTDHAPVGPGTAPAGPVAHGHHTAWSDVRARRPLTGATYGDDLARAVDRDRTGRDAYLATTFDDARRSELADRLRDLAWGMPTPRDHPPGCWRRHARCALELAADELTAGPPG